MKTISLHYDCGCDMGFELLGGGVRLSTDLNLCPIHAKQMRENTNE